MQYIARGCKGKAGRGRRPSIGRVSARGSVSGTQPRALPVQGCLHSGRATVTVGVVDQRLTDIETCIDAMSLGDRKAFSTLYGATSAKLFSVALRVLGSRAEAEDALQEIYVKIWRNAGRYRSGGLSPMTWLITIARNHAIDRLRARNAARTSPVEEIAQMPDTAPGPEATAMARSESGRIAACFDELEPERADAVRRAYLDGDSYRALAARYEIPLNTVRTWLRRSLLKLKECLSRDSGGEP